MFAWGVIITSVVVVVVVYYWACIVCHCQSWAAGSWGGESRIQESKSEARNCKLRNQPQSFITSVLSWKLFGLGSIELEISGHRDGLLVKQRPRLTWNVLCSIFSLLIEDAEFPSSPSAVFPSTMKGTFNGISMYLFMVCFAPQFGINLASKLYIESKSIYLGCFHTGPFLSQQSW